MHRLLRSALCVLVATPLLFAGGVRFGATLGVFAPRDNVFKSIYGSAADVSPGLVLGVPLWRGLSLRLEAEYYERNGETSFTGEITRLRIYPLVLGLRYTLPLRRVRPFLEAGYLHLQLTETAAIGSSSRNGGGYALCLGAVFPLSSRFELETFFRYTDVAVNADPQAVQMGGMAGGLAFLVRL